MTDRVEAVVVPNIGGTENVSVIEVLVKAGDEITEETSLITLEGDKATMEVPSPMMGRVESVSVKVGDKVSAGDVILKLAVKNKQAAEKSVSTSQKPIPPQLDSTGPIADAPIRSSIHAGPGVRRLARELNVDLSQVRGSGEKGRITKEDLQAQMTQPPPAIPSGVSAKPAMAFSPVDFSQWGEIETQPLSRIQKISGPTLQRNWVSIPHVTQFDEADITELEAFRRQQKLILAKQEVRLTVLVFVMKAVVAALKKFPHFNASLSANGEQLILKKYFHIGVAVDTAQGLVVPVIRHVDQKSIIELSHELASISQKVREKGLGLADMQGGCFTISSLGGIGGTAFTPIINAPEVAILGLSRAQMKPVYQEETAELIPRLLLPLSLSYDHRVIDGATAAHFIVYLTSRLSDIRTLLL